MYPPDPWQEISANAIDLINNFLWVQQRYRFTSGKSLIHPWLENFQTWVDLRSLKGAVGERYLLLASDGKSRLNNSKRANAANWWKIFTANLATERGLKTSTSFLWDSDAFISNELFLMQKYFNALSLKRQTTLRVYYGSTEQKFKTCCVVIYKKNSWGRKWIVTSNIYGLV